LVALIKALIERGQIVTTKAKAKAIYGQIDKLVSLAKGGTLAARRQVLAYLRNDRDICDKVFRDVLPPFATRTSGFTRMIPLPPRRGDNAEMARLEWVEKIASSEQRVAREGGKTPKNEDNKKVTKKDAKSKKSK